MKQVVCVLLAVGLLPTWGWAWSVPGEDFSNELTLGGEVTNTRQAWGWKTGVGVSGLDVVLSSWVGKDGNVAVSVPFPALPILLGKTMLTSPTGRVGLTPTVVYGRDVPGAELTWMAPGMAEVTLPISGDDKALVGHFTFRMQALAMLRHVQDGQAIYARIYDDVLGNGLPGLAQITPQEQTASNLLRIFANEGPEWLAAASVSQVLGVSQFSNTTLRQVEGVYGAAVVADSGQLFLKGEVPSRWRVSLPISVEYQ
ncbi:hypothetical protein ACEUAM_22560 [Aeromonas hydrophila]|uniref:F4 family fimbrial subunit n=1 Tax=Aeromonas hydrophila TaxID=644 RepID=UPI0038D1194B